MKALNEKEMEMVNGGGLKDWILTHIEIPWYNDAYNDDNTYVSTAC